jgi:genome maintenance exonuclease 1
MMITMNTRFKHNHFELGYDLTAKSTVAGRLYETPEGVFYPSVTTVLGHATKAGIVAWRKAVGEKEANRVSRHACARGNAVHNAAEKYINNEEEYLKEGTMPHVLQLWNAMKKVLDEKVDNVIMQEVPLYSDELMLAGRVDLICEFDGVLSIVDFKTSSRVKTRDQISGYFKQECAYAIMFEERTGIKIDQLVTVMVVDGSDDSITFIEKKDDWVEPLQNTISEYYDHLREKVKNL